MNANYCMIIKEISTEVKNWITRQSNVKEESLTDWFLDQLSLKVPFMWYKSFTRLEEARISGADWEWFVILNDGGVRFRVQAKRLKSNADNYSSIAYSNSYGMQIDKLIDDALIVNAIPIYAFYTSVTGDTLCGAGINDEGAYTSDAYNIRERIINANRVKALPRDLLQYSIPLSCMICCHMLQGSFNLHSYADFLNTYFHSFMAFENTIQTSRGLYKKIPEYIESFVNYLKDELPEWWEKEFSHEVKDLSGLIVTDLRDIKD